MIVHRHFPGLGIDRNAHLGKTQPLRERPAANRHQHSVTIETQAGPILLLGMDLGTGPFERRPGHLGLQVKLEALLGQALLEQVAHLLVGRRHDPRQELDHGDLRPQPFPDRAQLQADVARANHHQVIGNFVEQKRPRRIDDRLAVERQKGKAHRLRPRRQQDMAGLQVETSPFVERDLDRGRRADPASPEDRLDTVLAKQIADTVRQSLDHFILAGQHRRQVELQSVNRDAVLLEPLLRQVIKLARVEHRLARDAPHVQAGSPQRPALLDTSHLHPKLSSPDRRHVTPRPGADHHQIELCRHQ